MKYLNKLVLLLLVLVVSGVLNNVYSQNFSGGNVRGSFQMDFQTYKEDTLIGAEMPDEKMGMNAFLNVIYTNNNFETGVRYESYMPPMLGFDPRYEGSGIAHKYVKYRLEDFEFTAGNFYEQFGSGMILRSYQEWNLGFDNAFNGFRVKYSTNLLTVKALIGKQRSYWSYGDGLVRGVDVELSVNDLFEKLKTSRTRIRLGGNFVSKFEEDLDPLYKLPENVAAGSGRFSVFRGGFNAKGEFGYKINDPNASNGIICKDGHAALFQVGYSTRGFGVNLQAKRADNMDFRSERSATGFDLPINYIPSITKQHAYSMPAMYPNATQANGETGAQLTVFYKLKKNKKNKSKIKLGGKYGTNIEFNYSIVKAINKTAVNDTTPVGTPGSEGYKSDFFKIGKDKYYHDLNIKISRKLSKKWKLHLMYANIFYDMAINEGHFGEPDLKANVGVVDLWWKFKPYNSLHFETQALFTEEDDGDWASLMIEYKYKSFFAAIIDQYNYGNEEKIKQIHYYTISTGYTHKSTRISVSYGKQRQGILCIGGVCREVPASNGFRVSLSSSF